MSNPDKNTEPKTVPPPFKLDPKPPIMIPLTKFFTFLTPKLKLMLFIGTLAHMLAGAIVPVMAIFLGKIATAFNPN
jgi:hypothetical protein